MLKKERFYINNRRKEENYRKEEGEKDREDLD